VRDVGRADEAHCTDRRVIEDRIDHFLVAMDDLAACPRADLPPMNSSARRTGTERIALGRLEDEGVAGRRSPRRTIHSGIMAGEVERRDAGARCRAAGASNRCRCPGPRPAVYSPFSSVRDAAAEFDGFQPALDVALRIGNHLAVLGREQVRQLVDVRFDQPLELEHHAGAALRVDRSPRGLRGLRGGNGALQQVPPVPSATSACTAPVSGSNTGPLRAGAPPEPPTMK